MRMFMGLRVYCSRSLGVSPPHIPLRRPLTCSKASSDLRHSLVTGQARQILLACSHIMPFCWSPNTSGKNMLVSNPLHCASSCQRFTCSSSSLSHVALPNGKRNRSWLSVHASTPQGHGLLSRNGHRISGQGKGLSSGNGLRHTVDEWFASQSTFSCGFA
jgi:hypothetical protein